MLHGQEIYTFFNRHGTKGFIGLFFSMFLISFICYKTFKLMIDKNIDKYNELIDIITKDKKIFTIPIKSMVKIFLLVSFYIMVAGFSAYFFQEFGIAKVYGGIVIAILSLVTFYKGIKGVVKINLYLIPILIVLIFFLGIKNGDIINIKDIKQYNSFSWIKDSILYASYNSIVLIPTLIGMKKYICNKKENFFVFLFVIIIMSIIGTILYFILEKFKNEIGETEIPIVFIANKFGIIYKYVYGFIILIAIFTSAISAGYSFLINCTKSKKDYKFIAITICIISILVSNLKFTSLVNLLYPAFGYLGIIQLFFLIKH